MKRRAQKKSVAVVVQPDNTLVDEIVKPVDDDLGLNVRKSDAKRLRCSDALFDATATSNRGQKRGICSPEKVQSVPFEFWKRFRTDPAVVSDIGTDPTNSSKMAADTGVRPDLDNFTYPALTTKDQIHATANRQNSHFNLQDDVHKFEDTATTTHLNTPFGCFNFWKPAIDDLDLNLVLSKDVPMDVDILKGLP